MAIEIEMKTIAMNMEDNTQYNHKTESIHNTIKQIKNEMKK